MRPGDTLRAIGAMTGAGSEAIAMENDLAPPYTLRPGQQLRIPAGRYHRVAAGETGIGIAHAYGVDWGEVVEAGANALLVGGVLIAKWRDLLLHAFDPQQARAIGLSTRLLHYGLLCILALTIVGALRATGIILTIAMLIAPGAIAFLLTDRFARMLPIAVLVAVGATFTGVWLSFFLDSAPAPTIILIFTVLFVLAFGWRMYQTRRASMLLQGQG